VGLCIDDSEADQAAWFLIPELEPQRAQTGAQVQRFDGLPGDEDDVTLLSDGSNRGRWWRSSNLRTGSRMVGGVGSKGGQQWRWARLKKTEWRTEAVAQSGSCFSREVGSVRCLSLVHPT